jgi:hypothetical protein
MDEVQRASKTVSHTILRIFYSLIVASFKYLFTTALPQGYIREFNNYTRTIQFSINMHSTKIIYTKYLQILFDLIVDCALGTEDTVYQAMLIHVSDR